MDQTNFHLHRTNTISENALKARPYAIFTNVERRDMDQWKIAGFPKQSRALLTIHPTQEIHVPSNVQYAGFDYIQYTNHIYPFPYNPPHIDLDNPCYVYVTEYVFDQLTKEHIINFEGVDSCFYLYVNGQYVGYSSISHRHVEFLLNPFLKEGKNEIRVIVFKWNMNSYLEDQDKIRLTGIFRDVYVLLRSPNYLKDYDITTKVSGDDGLIEFKAEQNVELSLYEGDKLIFEKKSTSEELIRVHHAHLWNAENPFCYTLKITIHGEELIESIGIREFQVIDGVLLLNGKKIKLKGVNRHSFTLNGYAETREDLERDIQILKATNVNALRTAHYPPHPYLPYLCDRYGIYLMVEADLESHGSTMAGGTYDLSNYSLVSKMPVFYEQIIARSLIAYQSVKNRPSLFSFSLGNEAGYSQALVEACDQLHALNPNLLVHYETVFHSDNKADYYSNNLDFYSRMYADLAWCENHLKNHKDKPLILCEYTHSMGNSLGDAEDYQKLIEKYDNFAGAFVWEFISQSIRKDGKDLYGGDFGETFHDGNFCVDGLVEVDRTYTPQMHDLKEVFAPVDFIQRDHKLLVLNKHDFTNLNKFNYKLFGITYEGECILKSGYFNDTAPHETTMIADIEDRFISYRIVINEGEKVLSVKQVLIQSPQPKSKDLEHVHFVLKDGLIDKLILNNVVFSNMQIHAYRPPIDNERNYLSEYDKVGLIDARVVYLSKENDRYHLSLRSGKKELAKIFVTYVNDVNLRIALEVDFSHGLKFLPRFGVSFDIDDHSNVHYFGYGPYESYIDRHQGTTLGLYKLDEEDNYRYIKPQASGNHYGVHFVSVDDILITSNNTFETSIDNIDIYTYPTHRHLLTKGNRRTLYLDYKQSGVGSYACGPELASKYQLNEEKVTFILDFKSLFSPLIQ